MYSPEDDPHVGSKHVAYYNQPHTIKGSCSRRTIIFPLITHIVPLIAVSYSEGVTTVCVRM